VKSLQVGSIPLNDQPKPIGLQAPLVQGLQWFLVLVQQILDQAGEVDTHTIRLHAHEHPSSRPISIDPPAHSKLVARQEHANQLALGGDAFALVTSRHKLTFNCLERWIDV
jgi:hypothetical protein